MTRGKGAGDTGKAAPHPITPMLPERHFCNTFGYYELPLPGRVDIFRDFEDGMEEFAKLPPLTDISVAREDQEGRRHSIHNAVFRADAIHAVFYNDLVLATLKRLMGDFVVLSAMESFYLKESPIHRDFAGEIKAYKVSFYLDDTSTPDLGPLWCIPGSHHIYDRFSTSIACNVAWPPPRFRGDSFLDHHEFFKKNAPVHHFLSNADKVVIFNMALLHGSNGHVADPKRLRRAVCMTVIPVDRSDDLLMRKVDLFFDAYGIDTHATWSYLYCQGHNPAWLHHFRRPAVVERTGKHNEDSSDRQALVLSEQRQRFRPYLANIDRHKDEILSDLILNCYRDQAEDALRPDTPNGI